MATSTTPSLTKHPPSPHNRQEMQADFQLQEVETFDFVHGGNVLFNNAVLSAKCSSSERKTMRTRLGQQQRKEDAAHQGGHQDGNIHAEDSAGGRACSMEARQTGRCQAVQDAVHMTLNLYQYRSQYERRQSVNGTKSRTWSSMFTTAEVS